MVEVRFRITDILGLNLSNASVEMSLPQRYKVPGLKAVNSWEKGLPILPKAAAFFPAAFKTSAIKVVTVVLPLVPVMAITSAGHTDQANSISLIAGILEFPGPELRREIWDGPRG